MQNFGLSCITTIGIRVYGLVRERSSARGFATLQHRRRPPCRSVSLNSGDWMPLR
ncbi:hypothetical protein HanIR_Chr03g0108321 [Helianthus annuus]|nr:hypothetical protein HanIR_Chr03g0108321 [Helianthus annuus]